MDNDTAQVHQKIKRELADFMGIDMEDIEEETTLKGDLHMSAAEITDFLEILKTSGFDISNLNLTEIETFGELSEALTSHI